MAEVTVEIGGFHYPITCRDGEEPHLRHIASIVDAKVLEAKGAVGGVSEVRQLLFAGLLLADSLEEAQSKTEASAPTASINPQPALDPATLEALADRMEQLASRLENRSASA
jgi:cell division protein ZapA